MLIEWYSSRSRSQSNDFIKQLGQIKTHRKCYSDNMFEKSAQPQKRNTHAHSLRHTSVTRKFFEIKNRKICTKQRMLNDGTLHDGLNVKLSKMEQTQRFLRSVECAPI